MVPSATAVGRECPVSLVRVGQAGEHPDNSGGPAVFSVQLQVQAETGKMLKFWEALRYPYKRPIN